MLDGTWKLRTYSEQRKAVGRIKCGTESNGGFINITISNCVFDQCRGLALESVDGAHIEDIAITNLTMRGVVHSPFFLRLGARMRGPAQSAPGVLRRVLISNVSSYNAVADYPSIIAGIPGNQIEDVKISDVYLHQLGGAPADLAQRIPPEAEKSYPEASMFGPLPACGFYLRHVRNLEFTNVEIAAATADSRPAIWAEDVDGLDVFRLRSSQAGAAYLLRDVRGFRSFGSRDLPDRTAASVKEEKL
jgi:polygalacturonase